MPGDSIRIIAMKNNPISTRTCSYRSHLKTTCRLLRGVLSVFVLLGLAGCKAAADSTIFPVAQSTESLRPSSTSTPFLTSTSTLIPTLPQPTETLTSTPGPRNTLTTLEQEREMSTLLSNNGGCLLPCFLGMTLNESTYSDAEDILEPLSSISNFKDLYPSPGTIDLVLSADWFDIYSRLRFVYDESDIINHISFRVEARQDTPDGGYVNVFSLPSFGKFVSYYELPNVLTTYGIPESVRIGTLAGDYPNGGSWGFHILLLYPDQGLLIDYTTEMQLREDTIIGCPSNAHIELELYPSGNGETFFDLMEPTNWPQNIKSNYKPIEDVISMTIEEFYYLFREPNDRCIETPSRFWPIPE
jgi:hypothetical protein